MSGDVDADREEMFGDRAIGANVAILRGSRTQKAIADEMKKSGFKWTQTTVWEVESGKRSLKAKEARWLADALGTRVQNLFGETIVTQTRTAVFRRINKIQKLENEAAEAIEKYALERARSLALAEEVMHELVESGVDFDYALNSLAKSLKRLSTKTLEEALDDRASAIAEAKEMFGEGTTLRFYPGVREVVEDDEDFSILGEMLTEEEADGIDPEAS